MKKEGEEKEYNSKIKEKRNRKMKKDILTVNKKNSKILLLFLHYISTESGFFK